MGRKPYKLNYFIDMLKESFVIFLQGGVKFSDFIDLGTLNLQVSNLHSAILEDFFQ